MSELKTNPAPNIMSKMVTIISVATFVANEADEADFWCSVHWNRGLRGKSAMFIPLVI